MGIIFEAPREKLVSSPLSPLSHLREKEERSEPGGVSGAKWSVKWNFVGSVVELCVVFTLGTVVNYILIHVSLVALLDYDGEVQRRFSEGASKVHIQHTGIDPPFGWRPRKNQRKERERYIPLNYTLTLLCIKFTSIIQQSFKGRDRCDSWSLCDKCPEWNITSLKNKYPVFVLLVFNALWKLNATELWHWSSNSCSVLHRNFVDIARLTCQL